MALICSSMTTTQLLAEEKIEGGPTVATPPDKLLTTPPSESKIQVQYYPYDEKNGWYMHNKYRETLINKKLHECKALANRPLKVCTDEGIAKKKKYVSTEIAILVTAVSFMAWGFYMGRRERLINSRNDE